MADWKNYAKANIVGIGLSVPGVISDIASGKGVVKSIGTGVLDYAKWEIIGGLVGGPAMLAFTGVQLGTLGATIAIESGRAKTEKISRNVRGPGAVGGSFFDNQNAYTMRQRSLAAMGGHQGMVNNALGSEARRRAYNIKY